MVCSRNPKYLREVLSITESRRLDFSLTEDIDQILEVAQNHIFLRNDEGIQVYNLDQGEKVSKIVLSKDDELEQVITDEKNLFLYSNRTIIPRLNDIFIMRLPLTIEQREKNLENPFEQIKKSDKVVLGKSVFEIAEDPKFGYSLEDKIRRQVKGFIVPIPIYLLTKPAKIPDLTNFSNQMTRFLIGSDMKHDFYMFSNPGGIGIWVPSAENKAEIVILDGTRLYTRSDKYFKKLAKVEKEKKSLEEDLGMNIDEILKFGLIYKEGDDESEIEDETEEEFDDAESKLNMPKEEVGYIDFLRKDDKLYVLYDKKEIKIANDTMQYISKPNFLVEYNLVLNQ